MKIWYVYVDFTTEGRPFYVGKGTIRRVSSPRKDNRHWNAIVEKYGWYRETVIATKFEDAAFEFELKLIAEYDTFKGWGANHTAGGEGPTGAKRTAETKQRLSESHRGKIPWNKGKPQSEEHRLKNSESKKGKSGRKFSFESKNKIRQKALARSRWTQFLITEIKRLRETGLTIKEIARQLNCPVGGVQCILRYGIPSRSHIYRNRKNEN